MFSKIKDANLIAIFVILFIGVHLFFSPSFYAAIDEHEYLKNAVLLKTGSLFVQEPEYACRATQTPNGFIS
ncbi:MAG: hypothetical protein Q7K42_04555, partial [Candidatus Diapherotrites archaeon]|nr:hypothetical protein [Candidatus Diapherotrites archaeon]